MMKKIYNEFKKIHGFVGVCLYRANTGKLKKAMPKQYTDERLAEIGKLLTDVYNAGETSFMGIDDLAACDGDNLLVLRKITADLFVYVVAEADANLQLLRIALDLFSDGFACRSAGANACVDG